MKRVTDKKITGFTLIELLAVIAILAVLSIIAIPSVIKLYKQARLNTFITQTKNIYKAVNDEVMLNKINGKNITRFYYAKEISENAVKIKGNDKIYYDVEVSDGKITKISVSDEENSIQKEDTNGLGITALTSAEAKGKEEVGYIDVGEGQTYPQEVYGVEFNLTTGVYTRTDASVGKSYSNPTTLNEITSGFDEAQIYKEMTEETDSYGNVFIKIPKFYIKKTVNVDRTIWKYQISKEKKDNDYYLPACFTNEDTGEIYSYILVSKYNASLSADGTKLESKSGKAPLVDKNISQFRTLATANGSGYQLLDIHTVDVLQTLFYIEYATLDSASIMYGYGVGLYTATDTIQSINGTSLTLPSGRAAQFRVGQMIDIGTTLGGRQIARNLRITSISGNTITYEIVNGISETPGTIATGQMVYNVSYLTGVTDSLRTPSGSPVDNTSGKYPMKYRGIENLYSNIWQFIDGINIKDRVAYVAKNATQYASDVFTTPYIQVGYTNASTNNYVLKMGYDANNPFIQLSTEVTSTYANSRYKDYYYQTTGNIVAIFGGAWNNGSNSGVSYWYLYYSSSYTYLIIGARFLKTAL